MIWITFFFQSCLQDHSTASWCTSKRTDLQKHSVSVCAAPAQSLKELSCRFDCTRFRKAPIKDLLIFIAAFFIGKVSNDFKHTAVICG